MQTLINEINGVTSYDGLKAAGTKLFQSALSKEDRTAAVKVYKMKRKELDTALVAAAPKGSALSKALFHVNTMGKPKHVTVGKAGKVLFDLTKASTFTKQEADLLFRAFNYRKDMIVKAAALAKAA